MITCHQPQRIVQQVVEQKERVHRENIILATLLSLAFFFGCLLTALVTLALVVLSK